MTLSSDKIIIGILVVILLYVFYISHTTGNRIDYYEKELKSLQDSIAKVHKVATDAIIRADSLEVKFQSVLVNRDQRTKNIKTHFDKIKTTPVSDDSTAFRIRSVIQ